MIKRIWAASEQYLRDIQQENLSEFQYSRYCTRQSETTRVVLGQKIEILENLDAKLK